MKRVNGILKQAATMRQLFYSVVLLPGIIFASTPFDGDQKGGGGGVVCRDDQGKVTSVKVLDIQEAEQRNIVLDFGPKETDTLKVVDYILARMGAFDPEQAAVYRKQANEFFDSSVSKFLPNITLPFTEDTGPIFIQQGCKVEQIVLQRKPLVEEDRLFTVNRDLWDLMDANNQAALILHEIIYHEWLSEHQETVPYTSFWARYYNEYLLSRQFLAIDIFDYINFLKKCDFKGGYYDRKIRINGAVYYITGLEYTGKHLIRGRLLEPGSVFKIGNSNLLISGWVEFHENGSLHDGWLSEAHLFNLNGVGFNLGRRIKFYPDGIPSESELDGAQTIQINGKSYTLEGEIKFHPNGNPSTVRSVENIVIPFNSNCQHILNRSKIEFAEEGYLKNNYKPVAVCVLTQNGIWQSVTDLNKVEFHSNFYPKSLDQYESQRSIWVDVYQKAVNIWYISFSSNEFYEDGHIALAQLAGYTGNNVKLFCNDNQWHEFETGAVLKFGRDGKVIL